MDRGDGGMTRKKGGGREGGRSGLSASEPVDAPGAMRSGSAAAYPAAPDEPPMRLKDVNAWTYWAQRRIRELEAELTWLKGYSSRERSRLVQFGNEQVERAERAEAR